MPEPAGIEDFTGRSTRSHLDHSDRTGPTVLRILLGTQLRRLRDSRQISTEEAGRAIRGSHSKISRMEHGRVGFKERDIGDLLTLYGVTDLTERATMLELAREANSPGWWHRYGDVLPSWFEVYLGLEEAAALIRTHEAHFVPGLLQTRDYARSVIELGHAGSQVELRLDLRMHRQDRFTAPGGPVLWAVIDEAALRRPVGGRAVQREQIKHLVELAELPNITLQVVPMDANATAAAGGPFSILRFDQPELPDIVYLEQLTSALYLDKPADVDAYMQAMNEMCVVAARPEDTVDRLARLRDEI